MTDQTNPSAGELDFAGAMWRKSSSSGSSECVEVAALPWRKSSLSGHNGGCVEVAPTSNIIAVRDSKNPSGPVLAFAAAEWTAFLSGVRAGEFDL